MPTLAHCALCSMVTAIALPRRVYVPNIYARLDVPNVHFDTVMSFPLLVYCVWECAASGAHTDVSCKLTMAIAFICVVFNNVTSTLFSRCGKCSKYCFLLNIKTGQTLIYKISSIASLVEAAVSDAPPLNSAVKSFQNFSSSVLCQWACAIELLQQSVQFSFVTAHK
jgi:hypothetical protein